MTRLLTVLSVATPLGLIVGLWVLAQISRRFGEVTHRPPLYRGFYVAMGLVVFPLVARLVAVGLEDDDGGTLGGNTLAALLHDVPLALSIVLALVICWRYWGWLVYAHAEPPPSSSTQS
jgi:hypothetical protein